MMIVLGYNFMQGGRIGVVGAYAGFTNHYNIGAFMEKGLTMAAGQVCGTTNREFPASVFWPCNCSSTGIDSCVL